MEIKLIFLSANAFSITFILVHFLCVSLRPTLFNKDIQQKYVYVCISITTQHVFTFTERNSTSTKRIRFFESIHQYFWPISYFTLTMNASYNIYSLYFEIIYQRLRIYKCVYYIPLLPRQQ